MAMTRKNYVVLADIFSYHSNRAYANASALMAALLTDITAYLKEDNERFDKDKFLDVVHSPTEKLSPIVVEALGLGQVWNRLNDSV